MHRFFLKVPSEESLDEFMAMLRQEFGRDICTREEGRRAANAYIAIFTFFMFQHLEEEHISGEESDVERSLDL